MRLVRPKADWQRLFFLWVKLFLLLGPFFVYTSYAAYFLPLFDSTRLNQDLADVLFIHPNYVLVGVLALGLLAFIVLAVLSSIILYGAFIHLRKLKYWKDPILILLVVPVIHLCALASYDLWSPNKIICALFAGIAVVAILIFVVVLIPGAWAASLASVIPANDSIFKQKRDPVLKIIDDKDSANPKGTNST